MLPEHSKPASQRVLTKSISKVARKVPTFPSLELTRTSSQPSFNDAGVDDGAEAEPEPASVCFRSPSFGDVDDSDFLPNTENIFWTP